jgi:glycosyltransferase involved in cell wall biosynthesis
MLPNRISVVIPARNAEATILEAVHSALYQSQPPLEIIVVNDQSDDDTGRLLKSLGDKVVVIEGSGTGSGPARNLGVKKAKGDLIAFLDADDVWDLEKLAKQTPFVERGFIIGSYATYFVGTDKTMVGKSIRTKNDAEALEFVLAGKGMPLLLSSFLMFREDFIGLGGFDPDYLRAQDYELLLRACVSGAKLRIIREELLSYRLHHGSETASDYLGQYLTAEFVREKYLRGSNLNLKDWIETQALEPSIMKRARAGLFFRTGGINLRTGNLLEGSAQIVTAFILDPKNFARKVVRQSNFKLNFWSN